MFYVMRGIKYSKGGCGYSEFIISIIYQVCVMDGNVLSVDTS